MRVDVGGLLIIERVLLYQAATSTVRRRVFVYKNVSREKYQILRRYAYFAGLLENSPVREKTELFARSDSRPRFYAHGDQPQL